MVRGTPSMAFDLSGMQLNRECRALFRLRIKVQVCDSEGAYAWHSIKELIQAPYPTVDDNLPVLVLDSHYKALVLAEDVLEDLHIIKASVQYPTPGSAQGSADLIDRLLVFVCEALKLRLKRAETLRGVP